MSTRLTYQEWSVSLGHRAHKRDRRILLKASGWLTRPITNLPIRQSPAHHAASPTHWTGFQGE
jgi:hypothetical protein